MTTQFLANSPITGSPIAGVQTGWRATKSGWTPNGTGPIARVVWRLIDWQEGVFQRRRIAEMSDHMLRDVGLTRADLTRADLTRPS